MLNKPNLSAPQFQALLDLFAAGQVIYEAALLFRLDEALTNGSVEPHLTSVCAETSPQILLRNLAHRGGHIVYTCPMFAMPARAK